MDRVENSLIQENLIKLVLDRFTDALNHREWEKLEDMFTSNAIWRTVNFRDYSFKGARAIAEGFKNLIDPGPFLVQMRSATIVNINGNAATARSTMHEVGDLGGGSFICYGSYSDDLKCQDGVWRIAERKFRYFYWQEGTASGLSFPVK